MSTPVGIETSGATGPETLGFPSNLGQTFSLNIGDHRETVCFLVTQITVLYGNGHTDIESETTMSQPVPLP